MYQGPSLSTRLRGVVCYILILGIAMSIGFLINAGYIKEHLW